MYSLKPVCGRILEANPHVPVLPAVSTFTVSIELELLLFTVARLDATESLTQLPEVEV